MRRYERIPTRSLYIQGPASVLEFVAYANELKAAAYWEVLDKTATSASTTNLQHFPLNGGGTSRV